MCDDPDFQNRQNKLDGLSSLGNQNHWDRWIHLLETEIEQREESLRPLTDAPLYVSWLLLSSEYTAYRIRWQFFVEKALGEPKIFDASYSELLDKCKAVMSPEAFAGVRFAIQVRHIFVHKGFPNPHREPVQNARNLGAGVEFGETQVREVGDLIKNPTNYQVIRSRFQVVATWIRNANRDIEFGF